MFRDEEKLSDSRIPGLYLCRLSGWSGKKILLMFHLAVGFLNVNEWINSIDALKVNFIDNY